MTHSESSVNDEARWEIEQDLGLYRFYLDLLLKAAVFLFAITGGVISYYLANRGKEPAVVYSLLLPIVVNVGFSAVCGLSIRDAQIMRDRHYTLCVNAGVTIAWEMRPLPLLLKLFTVVYGLIALGSALALILGWAWP